MRSSRAMASRIAARRALGTEAHSRGPMHYLPQDMQARGFCLMPLIRGIHSGLTSMLDLERTVRGGGSFRASSSAAQGLWTAEPSGQRAQSFQTSASYRSRRTDGPTVRPTSNEALPEQMRSLMRSVIHPVVVCTSTHAGEPRAMTMSSFTSLTLTPTPLVTFNVRTPSRTLDAIASSRQFNIHILAGNERGKAVADHFTQGNMDGKGLWGMKYEAVEGEDGPPLLTDAGVMYVLRCRLFEEGVEGGLPQVRDHVMVLGEVVEVANREVGGNLEFGLAYADRKYREVGDVIPRKKDDHV